METDHLLESASLLQLALLSVRLYSGSFDRDEQPQTNRTPCLIVRALSTNSSTRKRCTVESLFSIAKSNGYFLRFEFLVGRQQASSLGFAMVVYMVGFFGKIHWKSVYSLELSYVQTNKPLLFCDGFFLESCVIHNEKNFCDEGFFLESRVKLT